MKMNKLKSITLSAFVFFLFAGLAASQDLTYNLTYSNCLEDGPTYATVTLSMIDCDNDSKQGVKIVVDPKEEVLGAGDNFGVKTFAFNYTGICEEIDVSLPTNNWKNKSEFGKFEVLTEVWGDRQNPLEIFICPTDCADDLLLDDFDNPNEDGYNFVAHIADFTDFSDLTDKNGKPIESCWFATGTRTFAEEIIFDADPSNGAVILTWTAVSEEDVLGYNILRKQGIAGTFEQTNDNIIAGKGSIETTVDYEFVDDDVQNRTLYIYKLEEVETDGNTMEHGPVKAVPRLIYGILGR